MAILLRFYLYICVGNSALFLILVFMEVSVYSSQDSLMDRKPLFRVRVSSPDTFDFHKSLEVLRTFYGANIVIDILVV